jgi:hypothetical protein
MGREYVRHLVPARSQLLTQTMTSPSYGGFASGSVHSRSVKNTMVRDARIAVSWCNALWNVSCNADDVGTNVGGTALAGCCWAVITGLRATR